MDQWVCLLRAVNLGARNRVSMPALRKALGVAGFDNVRTYLQSGNVVLDSPLPQAQVAAGVGAVIAQEFGLDTPVLLRTPQQIRDILDWCPFPDEATTQPTMVHVVHLDEPPRPERVAAVLGEDWSPEALVIDGTEACIRYTTGMRESRLQHATLLRRLGVGGTARNWRTLQAVAGMLAG